MLGRDPPRSSFTKGNDMLTSSKINVITAYVNGKPVPKSGQNAYGRDDPAGRGFYTMADMSDERSKEFMRSQKSSNNMARVDGEMVGAWNLEF